VPVPDQAGELLGIEVPDPRPEADVRALRRLRLQADQPLEDVDRRKIVRLEKQLPRECGAVERAPVEARSLRQWV
jgi:hypothetical protein